MLRGPVVERELLELAAAPIPSFPYVLVDQTERLSAQGATVPCELLLVVFRVHGSVGLQRHPLDVSANGVPRQVRIDPPYLRLGTLLPQENAPQFMSTGTVEERIDEMIVEKRKLADDLLAGDAEVNLTELSDEALTDPVRLDVMRAAS